MIEQIIEIEGVLSVIAIDYDDGSSETEYKLEDKRDKTKKYKLHFTDKEPHVYHGSVVNVRGIKSDSDNSKIKLASSDDPNIELSSSDLEILVATAPVVSGEQKTIVMVANFLDLNIACTIPEINDRFFNNPTTSVNVYYQEMSFQKLWLTGNVVGPYTINYTTTSPCDLSAWTTATTNAAIADGVNISNYNRLIYVLPRTNSCGYTGVGTVGGNPSSAWIFRCDRSETYAHELGHNLGMNHASTPTDQYGDVSDIMGYSGLGLHYINAPHQEQMGWLDSSKFQNITENGIYNISPLEQNTSQALYSQVLVFPKPDTTDSYYLSYRQPIGFDSALWSQYINGVNIHHYKSGLGTRTILLNTLSDGGNYTDSVNGITITQISHNTDYVTVNVQLQSTCPQVNVTFELI